MPGAGVGIRNNYKCAQRDILVWYKYEELNCGDDSTTLLKLWNWRLISAEFYDMKIMPH